MSKSNLENLSNQSSQALAQQATLSGQLQNQVNISNTFKHLFNSYRELKGITLNPLIVITKTISAEELAHTDVLKEASKSQHSAAFDLALAKITVLDHQDIDGKTVLMHAIINGFYYGVDKLLQKGADVNLIDKQDANALIYCAQIPHIKYIKQIAEKTTDINCKATFFEGNTALHLVIANTKEIMFSSELNNDFRDSTRTEYPKLIVCDDGRLMLGSLGGPNITNIDIMSDGVTLTGVGQNPNDYPITQEKTLRITKFLTDRGADINTQNDKGLTPFFMACEHGFRYLTYELLKQYQNVIDFSSLAIRNNVKTLEFLETDTNIIDIIGNALWHYASQYGAINTMKFLKNKIPNIIDLKTTDDINATALHIASESGQLVTVQWLVGEHADINAKTTKQGFTPFFIACIKKNTAIAEYIFNHPKFNNTIIDNFGYGSLHWVLAFKDVSWVEKVLNKGGIDINHQDAKGLTALSWCAHYNLPQIIKFLLDNGANSLILSKDGAFPIHEAVATEALEVIKVLINYDKTIVDKSDEKKVLWFAAQEGKLEAVKTLLQLGANINAVNVVNGMTALYIAMKQKHIAVVQELLDKGVNVKIVDAQGQTALHYATFLEDTNILQLILNKGVDINSQNSGGGTALSFAICNDKKPMVEFLLNKGADVNVSAKDGGYPLHLAVNNNALELINLLVKYGDINARSTNEHKITALWLASQDGKLEIVKMLANLGADLNIVRADTGYPPLYIAMHQKRIAVAEELLARGADINIVTANGWTALHCGVYSTNKAMVEILLNKGAEVNVPAKDGWYPWHVASFQGSSDVMQLLFLKNPDINLKTTNAEQYTALWLASQQGHSNIVKWLAEHRADVNIASQVDGTTALQIAIVNNHLPVVKVLVEECKADINKANLDGVSPLYYSLGYWHQDYKLEITKFLIEYGAGIDKKTAAGDQPIHRASNLADVKAMKLLLDHGASINEVNNDGYTPLHFLVSAENTIEVDKKLTAIKYLLEHSASTTIKNKEGKSAIDLAKDNFPEALPWLEHPENLPPLSEFEASVIGLTSDFVI